MTIDSRTGPTWAGEVEPRPPPWLLGLTLRIWARQSYRPEAALWRVWVFSAEATVASEELSGHRRELVLGDGLAKVWAIAAGALEV